MTPPAELETSIPERSEVALREMAKLLEDCFTVGAVSDPALAGRRVEGRLEIIFQLSRDQREASAGGATAILGAAGITNDGLLRQTVTRWGADANEGPVFVHQVEVMATSEQSVPAPCLAESRRQERIGGIDDTTRYFAILHRTFELLPRFVDWEAALAGFCRAVGNGTDCRASNLPERTNHLDARLANDCADRMSEPELGDRLRSLRERLLSKTVRARFTHQQDSSPGK